MNHALLSRIRIVSVVCLLLFPVFAYAQSTGEADKSDLTPPLTISSPEVSLPDSPPTSTADQTDSVEQSEPTESDTPREQASSPSLFDHNGEENGLMDTTASFANSMQATYGAILIIAILLHLGGCSVVAALAESKGRSAAAGFFFSFFFSPYFGLLWMIASGDNPEEIGRRAIRAGKMEECRQCRERIRKGAVLCRHCQYIYPERVKNLPEASVPPTVESKPTV